MPEIIKRDVKEQSYRVYVTDALRIAGENMAKLGGIYLKDRWVDIIHPPKEETRTAEEIIVHMKKKLEEVS